MLTETSALTELLPHTGALAMFAGLALCDLVAMGLSALPGRWGRALCLGGMSLMLYGLATYRAAAGAQAIRDWWTGEATWSGAADLTNPDRVSRLRGIPPRSILPCFTPPGWYGWYDDAVGALVWAFGVGPGAYDGPYPTQAQALSILEREGQPLRWGEGAELLVGEQRYPLHEDRPTPEELNEALERAEALREAMGFDFDELDGAHAWELSAADLERGLFLRAAPLRHDALLVETATAIELRTWNQLEMPGRTWARWEK